MTETEFQRKERNAILETSQKLENVGLEKSLEKVNCLPPSGWSGIEYQYCNSVESMTKVKISTHKSHKVKYSQTSSNRNENIQHT